MWILLETQQGKEAESLAYVKENYSFLATLSNLSLFVLYYFIMIFYQQPQMVFV